MSETATRHHFRGPLREMAEVAWKFAQKVRAVLVPQRRLADLFSGPGEDLFQEGQKDRLARRGHKTRQAPVDEPGPFHAEQGGSRQVHLQDPALFIQGEIADRGEIVEVGVFLQQRLHPVPGFLELGVLHLQFDLVDLQFVEQPLGVGCRLRISSLGR